MEELLMCRICLSTNKRMKNLVGTYLQKMYEDLTTMLFVTKDNRPIMVCYICCARLKNSHQLKMRCLQSEKLFTQVLADNVTVPDIQEDTISTDRLQITPVIHLSIGNVQNSVLCSAEKEIKKEVPEVEVIVKREVSEEPQDCVDESFQEYYITLEDNMVPMDSDDLITLNTEPEKSRLAAQRLDCEESPCTLDISEDNSKRNKSITNKDIKNKIDRYKNIKKKKTGFVTKDNRPIMVCSICCARLKNSHQLKMRCLQSEKLFTQLLAYNVTVPDIQEDTISTDRLQITPVIHLSIGNVQNSVLCSAEKEIKKEVPEVEVIVKKEVSEEPQDCVDESFQEYYITLEDNMVPMDSDDLITLNTGQILNIKPHLLESVVFFLIS
ncbi:unnamed protein product [Arctia plantaginis]|uniref:ZAD domain-containing protein n=1 Tax=Arctia plantaginis TaxID=874455 RepID=A0A8S1AVP7_ARCPL|nr:unnamed protein product [Arctia plantaginis]